MRVLERLPDEYAGVREILIKYRNAEIITGESHTGYSYIWNAIPDLTGKTGLQYRDLSDYMLRLNLLLIQKAPLEYLQDVAWSLASYWLPSSDRPANMNSRMVQLVWAVIHFSIVGAFALNLILIIGAGTYLKASKTFVWQSDKALINKFNLIGSEAFIYGLAGTIVFYNTISCFIEVGLPRYRVPTDALIVFMLFLGTHLWRHLLELSGLSICGSSQQLAS
jgi:hypothetical protein